MNFKKNIFFCITLITLFSGCEKDDFCIEPVTPKFVIRFYDALNDTELKNTNNLYVWADGRDTIYSGVSTDSIALPLELDGSITLYNLSQGNDLDQLTIKYDLEQDYVSRSCGFRAIFSNVFVNYTNNWIDYINPETIPFIDNDNQAHVKIFH